MCEGRSADVSRFDPQPIRASEMRSPSSGMTLNDSVYDQLLLLSAEDDERDIALYINSPGGSVTAGMAIFDTMQFVDCDVATYAMGLAASMGQFLLSAGTRGRRYALPHS